MLTNRPIGEKSSHICWRRKYSLKADNLRSGAATRADESGETLDNNVQSDNPSLSSSSSASKTISNVGTLTGPDARIKGAHKGQNSDVSISVQPNFVGQLFILFAVPGKRITLDLENVDVQAQHTDHSFFLEILRKYRHFRGVWEMLF